jgi:hypothetical protein
VAGRAGSFNSDPSAPSFHNSEERDRWQVQQYGRIRNWFRTDEDPRDDRPLLFETHPFWVDDTERMTYEEAVESHPRGDAEGALSYIARIVEIVTGRYLRAGLSLPRHQTRRERDEALAKLRRQATEQAAAEARRVAGPEA